MSKYSEHFLVRGKDIGVHATKYLSGLLGNQSRKNIECIGTDVVGSNYQGMQQMLSDSPWSAEGLMDQIGLEAQELLGGHRDSGLYFDETSFVKKGEHSVGVQRQYCGRLGKTENCQVGVFASLGRGERATLIDFRLFLPEAWAKDTERCERARVPEDQRNHRTRTELAMEMVMRARDRKSNHKWIGADAAYGTNQAFCAELEDLGEKFVMDVLSTTKVWNADPRPQAPEPKGQTVGRRGTRYAVSNTKAKEQSIQELVAQRFEKESRMVTIRKTSQGSLEGPIWVCEVWVWDGSGDHARSRLLVVRKESDGKMKYSWSNFGNDTSWERLAYMQAQRYWIERVFEDAKSELGMAQYEVRGWKGWHHHMALVSLAMLFVLRERVAFQAEAPLLTTRDIVELLEFYIPRRGTTEKEVLHDLVARHTRRIQASKSHAKRGRIGSDIT